MRLLGHRYYIMVSPSSTASTASENKSEKGVWFSLRYRFESLRFAATFLKPCRISRSWDGSKHLAVTVFINAAAITTERREKIGGGGLSHLQWSTCSGRVIAGRRVRLRSIRDSTNAKSNRDIQRSLRFFIYLFVFFPQRVFPEIRAETFSRSLLAFACVEREYRREIPHGTISRDRDFAISNEPESCIAKFSQEAARASVFSRKDHKTTLWNPVVWLERFKKKKETNKNLQIEQQKALGLCPVVFFIFF